MQISYYVIIMLRSSDENVKLIESVVTSLKVGEESSEPKPLRLLNHFKTQAKAHSFYYIKDVAECDDLKPVEVQDLSYDFEYDILPDGTKCPITLSIAYAIPSTKGISESLALELPYIKKFEQYTHSEAFPVVSDSSYIVAFCFDCRGVNEGEDTLWFIQAMISNIYHQLGISPNLESIHKTRTFDNDTGKLHRQSTMWATLTDAEISLTFPTKPSRVKYIKEIRELINSTDEKDRDTVKDNKPKFLDINHSTLLKNLWLCLYNPNIQNSITMNDLISVDIADTKNFNGNSVKQLGKALGLDKVSGFDFAQHSASYYCDNFPDEFYHYNIIDSVISLGIIHVRQSFFNHFEDAVNEGLIDDCYYNSGGDRPNIMTWEELAELKTTIPALGEMLVFGFMRKKGLFTHNDDEPNQNSKIAKDKAKGVFTDNKKYVKEEFGASYKKVKGGLNQRTTGTMKPEFFENCKQYDANSMYPSIWSSGLRIPLWKPETFGSCKCTVKDLYEMLKENVWYEIKISCKFPKDSKKITRLILQHEEDKCFVSRTLNEEVIRPPELELMVLNHPNMDVTIHGGHYWDESLVKKPVYVELKDLADFIFEQRNKYPKVSLENVAIKLMGNAGIYGKLAQSKEQIDNEAYENALINDSLDNISIKTDGEGVLSHPVVANAITACGRTLNALVTQTFNGVACVTDSVLIVGKNVKFDMSKCKSGFYFLDMLVEGVSYKDETDDGKYMAIVCGARGKTLIHHDKELASLLSCLDSQEKIDKAKSLIKQQAQKMSNGELPIPKIAKDGIKYDGKAWEQWEQCALDSIDRLGGHALDKKFTRLVKSKEVMNESSRKNTRVCQAVEVNRRLDCVDFASYDFEDFAEYEQVRRTKTKLNKDKNGKSFGETYIWDYEQWLERYNRARKRTSPSMQITAYWKRALVFLADLGIISMQEISKISGVHKRTLSQWKQKLIDSDNYHYWVLQLFDDVASHKSVTAISENCKIDSKCALEQSSLEDIDEIALKKADKAIKALLHQLEAYFEVKLQNRSKRAKKLVAVA